MQACSTIGSAAASKAEGWGFESLQACQYFEYKVEGKDKFLEGKYTCQKQY